MHQNHCRLSWYQSNFEKIIAVDWEKNHHFFHFVHLSTSKHSFPLKWHSDPWPTVTFQPIRLSTNFMTSIPSLTFTELWVVSKEHLQRVWLASRERLPFRTPGSVPLFGTCLCSNCWDQIPTPWYFLDFAFSPKQMQVTECSLWKVHENLVPYCNHLIPTLDD